MVLVELELLRRQASWTELGSTPTPATFPVVNPATGDVIAEVPRMGAAETRRALAAAERALPSWKAGSPRTSTRRLGRVNRVAEAPIGGIGGA